METSTAHTKADIKAELDFAANGEIAFQHDGREVRVKVSDGEYRVEGAKTHYGTKVAAHTIAALLRGPSI